MVLALQHHDPRFLVFAEYAAAVSEASLVQHQCLLEFSAVVMSLLPQEAVPASKLPGISLDPQVFL